MDDQSRADREEHRPGQDQQHKDGGPAERQHGRPVATSREKSEQPPRQPRELMAEDACSDAGVEHRQEHVEKDGEHQEGAEDLLQSTHRHAPLPCRL